MLYIKTLPAAILIALFPRLNVVQGQTYSKCDPLQQTCAPDLALGRAVNIDFSSGASDSFTSSGQVTYDSDGASFTISKSGDSPTIVSKWYIMFGRVEVVLKAATGVGIVSSSVLQSDDLDEIDWEWLGADPTQAQSNYFGKGNTATYNRGGSHADPTSQSTFNSYVVDWTPSQIVWSINGQTVRVLTPDASAGQYPQTPMQVKLGAWSAGDSSNPPGTIAWAGGVTTYSNGPFTMQVKSLAVTDYSTGTQYQYSGTSGTWESIVAVGGAVNSGAGATNTITATPAVTSTSGQPVPFQGSAADTTSSQTGSSQTGYPWVVGTTTLATSTVSVATTYSGLPSGWTVSSSGKVVPPAAPASVGSTHAACGTLTSAIGYFLVTALAVLAYTL